jgi:pyridoxal phosphate enzyme (YggS family)
MAPSGRRVNAKSADDPRPRIVRCPPGGAPGSVNKRHGSRREKMEHVTIAENLANVRRRIAGAADRAGRAVEDVALLVVVKTRSIEEILEVHRAGERLVGFNRVEEAREKIPLLPSDLAWHMIGSIQTKKAKLVPPLFRMAHSVDAVKLAEALNAAQLRRLEEGTTSSRFDVLLEVNVSGEASKHGFRPDEIENAQRATARLEALEIRGLMTMAPFVADPEEVRPVFRGLRALRDRLRSLGVPRAPLEHLSMGMTNDFEIAVEEGATIARIGTAIFEGRG